MKKIFVPVLLALLFVTACKKCPFMPKTVDRSEFQIIDSRIGTGSKTLEVYKNKFKKTEKMVLAYDLINLTGMKEGYETMFYIRQDLAVKDKEENIITLKPGIVEMKNKITEKPLRFVNELDLASTGISEGSYYAEILVTDLASFKQSSEKIEFEVVK